MFQNTGKYGSICARGAHNTLVKLKIWTTGREQRRAAVNSDAEKQLGRGPVCECEGNSCRA
jgi:hypothetical protein